LIAGGSLTEGTTTKAKAASNTSFTTPPVRKRRRLTGAHQACDFRRHARNTANRFERVLKFDHIGPLEVPGVRQQKVMRAIEKRQKQTRYKKGREARYREFERQHGKISRKHLTQSAMRLPQAESSRAAVPTSG
jgi:hypothetical protein